MKVRVKVRPGGLLNGQEWPEVGDTLDLPDVVAEGMISAGAVEAVEKKAAKKPAKKAAAKPDTAEKRPAAKGATETRKG